MNRELPEESAEELFENAPCGYFSTLPDGTLIRVNRTFLQWTGYERETLLAGRRWQELLTVPGRIFYETHFAPLLQMQGVVNEIACDFLRPGRAPLPVLINAVQVLDAAGQPLLLRFTVFDATDRRRYERELLEARRRAEHYAVIVKASADAILSLSPNGLVQTWNAAAERLFGYTAAEAVGRTVQALIKLDKFDARPDSVLTKLRTGQAVQFETVCTGKDGRKIDVSLSLTPLLEPPGELTGISVILHDISELKRHERNLAFLAEIMVDFAPLKTSDEIMPAACAKIKAHFDLSRCVFLEIDEAADEAEIIHDGGADDLPSLVGVYRLAEFLTTDERRELAVGHTILINDVSAAPRDPEAIKRFAQLQIGALVYAPSISDDRRRRFVLSAMQTEPRVWRADEIELLQELSARMWLRLERAHAEESLRESEERLRVATEAAEMFSWECDLQQQSIKWSENAARLLGCTPEELPADLAHSLFFVAPGEVARMEQEFAEFLRQGVSNYTLEFRGREEGNQLKYWQAHGLVLYDADGTPLRVVGITQNITGRKQAEVTKRLLAEMRERNRLAQELHDTVAQALGYLNLKISTTHALLTDNQVDPAKASLQELKSVISETYTDVREEIFNLKAKLLSNMSFMELLQRYIDRYQRFYNLEIQLLQEADPVFFQFPPEVTVQLIRTIQEALINIRKHARVNTATIRLGRANGALRISIEDAGQGFDPAQSQGKSSSFGLQIMRERIESVGGGLEIDTVPGQGTRVVLHYGNLKSVGP